MFPSAIVPKEKIWWTFFFLFIDKNSSCPKAKSKTLSCKAVAEVEKWWYLKEKMLSSAQLSPPGAVTPWTVCYDLFSSSEGEGVAGYKLCCTHPHVGCGGEYIVQYHNCHRVSREYGNIHGEEVFH